MRGSIYHRTKNRKLEIKDSKINRSYLQLAYTKKAFEESYNTKLDGYYVLCVYHDKEEIVTERVEHPNWFIYHDDKKLMEEI